MEVAPRFALLTLFTLFIYYSSLHCWKVRALLEWPEQMGGWTGNGWSGVDTRVGRAVADYAVSCRIGAYISAYSAYAHIFSQSA